MGVAYARGSKQPVQWCTSSGDRSAKAEVAGIPAPGGHGGLTEDTRNHAKRIGRYVA
jgi:hypothetical protein